MTFEARRPAPALAVLALAAAALAAGCAAPRAAPAADVAAPQPLLQLAPASLGGTLALHQQLEIEAGGATHRLEVLLEADAAAVRIAVLGPGGQAAARITWDGRRLEHEAPPWWPPGLGAPRVLSDLQLVLWPAPVVARALAPHCRLDVLDGERRLHCGRADERVATVRHDGPARAELVQHRAGYRIRIESRPAAEGAS